MKIISRSIWQWPCNIAENLKTNFGGPGFTFLLPSLAQRILFGYAGSDPEVLTLVQGFDCGNKYDYWSCV